jgi:hypothetical protein
MTSPIAYPPSNLDLEVVIQLLQILCSHIRQIPTIPNLPLQSYFGFLVHIINLLESNATTYSCSSRFLKFKNKYPQLVADFQYHLQEIVQFVTYELNIPFHIVNKTINHSLIQEQQLNHTLFHAKALLQLLKRD